MAQQTQLDRVVPVFRRFLVRFPSVQDLSAAEAEDVVHAFSGLGYYRRARLLHQAARAITERGAWPTTFEALRALPGFGTYTAAAVAAFAFGGSEPPVDGNVARVTARLGAQSLVLGSGPLLKKGRLLASAFYAEVGTPHVWEALMELGATVCTPSKPACASCPLASGCAGLRAGTPTAFPLPRARRAREVQRWAVLWLERPDGSVLLRRVDDVLLLAGLWLPPFAVLSDGASAPDAARDLARASGFDVPLTPAATVKHGITHRDIRVLPFVGAASATRVGEAGDGSSWQQPHAPAVGVSSLVAKLARVCARNEARRSPAESEE
jgi:A/G-specific adenine glycosylase